jgi:hypothetical protein
MKIVARYDFGEFLGFFPLCLKPFKIQTKFKFILLHEFLIQICWEFELPPKMKVVPFEFIFYIAKFGNFWSLESTSFILCIFLKVFE